MDLATDNIDVLTATKPKFSKKLRKKYKQIRPKVSTDWSHSDVMTLINAVADRPSLWDTASEQYKSPKPPVWKEIADIIGGVNADECKAKWSNLRVTFSVNKRKEQQNPGSATNGQIIWKYFNAMKFLDANEMSQRSDSISSITQFSEESNSLVAESEQLKPSEQESLKENSSVPPPQPQLVSNTNVFREIIETAICAVGERSREKDQFETFGNYVAAELRSLPEAKAVLAKRKLARALVDIMDEIQS